MPERCALLREEVGNMSAEENKAIMIRFFDEAVNQGNVALIDEVFSPIFVNHDPAFGTAPDREGAREYLKQLLTAFPDLHGTIDHIIAEDDMVVIHASAQGTHQGSLMGVAPTSKRIEMGSVTIRRMVDGKVVERWYVLDRLKLMEQLRLVKST